MSNNQIPAHLDALGSTRDQPTSRMGDVDEAVRRAFLALQAAVKPPLLENNGLDVALRCYAARLVEPSLDSNALGSGSLTDDVDTLLEDLRKELYFRYEETEDINHLDLAVEYSEIATKMTASDHPDYKTRLDFLAQLLETRFISEGTFLDIENAIQFTRAAVIATKDNDDEIVRRWSNLGKRLGRRYGSGGTIDDLEEGISYLSQAVKVPKHPIFSESLVELAFCLELRFDELAEIKDLDEAISLRRQALQATIHQDEFWLDCLRNLANDLEVRYKSIKQLLDLQNAINLARTAITIMENMTRMEIIGPDYYLAGACFYELGTKLGLLYEKTNIINHVNEAIICSLKGVGATESPKEVSRHLEHLWTLRYRNTQDINDFRQASTWAEDAARWERAD